MRTPHRPHSEHTLARRRSGASILSAGLLVALAGTSASLHAANGPAKSAAAGVVYIESNDPRPGQNAVLAFRRAPDCSLTPLGSFPTAGAGVGNPNQVLGPNDSDQEMIASPDHRFLFAVNSGSNSVAVFQIETDGSLTPVKGSPFRSGGVNPVSVGISGDRLYVVNKDMDPAQDPSGENPSYTAFRIAGNGGLTPIPHSEQPAPARSSPSQAKISPNGKVLFDAQFMGGALASFQIEPNGRPVPAPGSPQLLPDLNPTTPALPLGLAVHPSLNILYAGIVTLSRIAVYTYDGETGALSFATDVSDSGRAPCWVIVNANGSRLYASNTGDRSVSVYSLDNPLAPVEIQRVVLVGPGSTFQLGLDPTGSCLYVVSERTTTDPSNLTGNGLHILQVAADGTLTEAPSSPISLPVPPFARPQGVVAL